MYSFTVACVATSSIRSQVVFVVKSVFVSGSGTSSIATVYSGRRE